MLFVCVNCVGVFHLWTTENDLRASNKKREEFSVVRSQKEVKKYQQVKRLLYSYTTVIILLYKCVLVRLYSQSAGR